MSALWSFAEEPREVQDRLIAEVRGQIAFNERVLREWDLDQQSVDCARQNIAKHRECLRRWTGGVW